MDWAAQEAALFGDSAYAAELGARDHDRERELANDLALARSLDARSLDAQRVAQRVAVEADAAMARRLSEVDAQRVAQRVAVEADAAMARRLSEVDAQRVAQRVAVEADAAKARRLSEVSADAVSRRRRLAEVDADAAVARRLAAEDASSSRVDNQASLALARRLAAERAPESGSLSRAGRTQDVGSLPRLSREDPTNSRRDAPARASYLPSLARGGGTGTGGGLAVFREAVSRETCTDARRECEERLAEARGARGFAAPSVGVHTRLSRVGSSPIQTRWSVF